METRSATATAPPTAVAALARRKRGAEDWPPTMTMFDISCQNPDQLRTSRSWDARCPMRVKR